MTEQEDHDLRDRFAAQQLEESASAPGFQHTLAATRARSVRRGGGLRLAAALALVALIALLAVHNRHRPDVDLAGVRIRTPTDFLLQLPGAEMLRTVPTLTSLERGLP